MQSPTRFAIVGAASASPSLSLAAGLHSFDSYPRFSLLGDEQQQVPPRLAQKPIARLSRNDAASLQAFTEGSREIADQDKSSQLSSYLCERAFRESGWQDKESETTFVSIGSSRGTGELLEKRFTLSQQGKRLPVDTSPTTTLGSLSTFPLTVLPFATLQSPIAMTCSSGLLALINGCAWIKAGLASRALVGGVDTPLTPFTVDMLSQLGIYSKVSLLEHDLACRPFEEGAPFGNTFVLGEGGGVLAIEPMENALSFGRTPLGEVLGVGVGFEKRRGRAAISPTGECFRLSMSQALSGVPRDAIDAVILHGPGTIAGDQAELSALYSIFGEKTPNCYSTKWLFGHTLGASGILSLLFALRTKNLADFPYQTTFRNIVRPIQTVLVNSAGFGGGACTVLIRIANIERDEF